MRTIYLALFCTLIIFVQSCSNSNKKSDLNYFKESSSSIEYDVSYSQNSEAYMNGQPMSAIYDVSFPLKMENKNNQGKILSNLIIPNINAKITLSNGQQLIDTRNLENIKLELSMSDKGGDRKLKILNETQLIDFGEMLGGKLDWDAILVYMTPSLPEKTIKPDDTWTENISAKRFEATMQLIADIEIEHKAIKYEKIEGRECILVNSSLKSVLNEDCPFMGSTFKISGNLTGKISWYFDIEQGVIVKMKVEDTSEGKIESPDGTMDATYKQSTTIEFNLKS